MPLPLARLARAKGIRRSKITLRPVTLPGALASDLFSIYAPILSQWTEALPTILASYERTLASMTTDSPEDTVGIVSQVEAALTGVFVQIRPRLAVWAARVEAAHRRKWAATVLAGAKVDLSTMLGSGDVRQTVGAVIEANVSVVRSVADDTRKRIANAVLDGFQRRLPARDVAAAMREGIAIERRRSIRIAGDQLTKLGSQLNDERRRQAGITQWEWVHSGKVHARPEHVARNGEVYSEDDLLDDRPGYAINCGCTSRAVIDIDAMIAAELEREAA